METPLIQARHGSRASPHSSRRPRAVAALLAACLSNGACGVARSTPSASNYASRTEAAGGYAGQAVPPALPELGLASSDRDTVPVATAAMAAAPESEGLYAGADAAKSAAAPPPSPAPDRPPPLADTTRDDAVQAGPILVYSASFLLSVYEVEKAQVALKRRAQELGGFVASQTDAAIVLRVPAPKFELALEAVESAGKVRARNVQALDVGDEYRDVQLRLHTAELLRKRLEEMLERAQQVTEALKVQAELERIVREIEELKGLLRKLNDRIAFSTLAVEFRPEARPDIDDSEVFPLPFRWLEELGLHQLLELAP